MVHKKLSFHELGSEKASAKFEFHKSRFFFASERKLKKVKKPPADLKEEMSGVDGGGFRKRVFLGCKKHAFSGSEEAPKKPPEDPKKKVFLKGGEKRR